MEAQTFRSTGAKGLFSRGPSLSSGTVPKGTVRERVMSFGGFGLWEILLIFVIALIVFGPDKLPELARTLGKGLREITMLSHQFSQELNRQLQEPPEQEQPPKQQESPQNDSRPAGVEGDGHKP